MIKLPPLKALRVFEALGRLKHVTLAAEELHVTQPAISQQLRVLENHFGFELFIRQGRRLILTPKATQYAEQLSVIFEQLRAATYNFQQPSDSNIITINTMSSFFLLFLMPHLHDFYQRYPEYELRILTPAEPVDFNYNNIDVVIYSTALPWVLPEKHDLDQILLYQDNIAAVCGTNYQVDKRAVFIKTQAKHSAWRNIFNLWFDKTKKPAPRPEQLLQFKNMTQAVEAAKNDLGILIAPYMFVSNALNTGQLQFYDNQLVASNIKNYWLCPNDKSQLEKVMVFKQWLIDKIQKYSVSRNKI